MKARLVVTNRPNGRPDLDRVVSGTVDALQDAAREFAHWEGHDCAAQLLDLDTGDVLFRAGSLIPRRPVSVMRADGAR